jgi:gas vesicle protein
MENQNQEQQHNGNQAISFLAGMLLGGLAGAAAMLLMAPQSGKKTRDQIQHKSIELRDQATETVGNAMAQVGQTAQQITGDVREKAEELQQRGQDLFDEQRGRLSAFVEGENKEIKISS